MDWKAKLTELCGRLGGALRAHKRLRAAIHMIAARYETKPQMLFRMGRTSDMYTPHSLKQFYRHFGSLVTNFYCLVPTSPRPVKPAPDLSPLLQFCFRQISSLDLDDLAFG